MKRLIYICSLLAVIGAFPVFASTLVAWGGGAIHLPDKEKSPPHNSLELMECASVLGFQAIELDIRMSKDGVPMLARSREINDHFSSALKQMPRVRWRGETVRFATLEEAIALENRPKTIVLDCRTKESDTDAIAEVVRRSSADPADFIFTAYSVSKAKAFANALPGSRVFLKTYREPDIQFIGSAADAGLSGVMFQVRDILSEPVIERIVTAALNRNLDTMSFVHLASYGAARMSVQVAAGVDWILSTTRYDDPPRSCEVTSALPRRLAQRPWFQSLVRERL